jgi:Domain of unknown function (DUF4168)
LYNEYTKVIEQAILYRVNAAVSMDYPSATSQCSFVEDPTSTKKSSDVRNKKQTNKNFCNTLIEIEMLKKKQIQQLMRSVNIKKLPDNVDITNESLLPLLSPKVRAVVNAFPLQAEEIVQKHGLDVDEFNVMLRNAKSNPFFRWRLRLQLGKRL